MTESHASPVETFQSTEMLQCIQISIFARLIDGLQYLFKDHILD